MKRILSILVTYSVVLLATSCGDTATSSTAEVSTIPRSNTERAKVPQTPPLFRTCATERPFTPPTATSFQHRRSAAVAKLGRVAHSGQDVIAKPGEPVVIPGKFAYGRVSKDLEGESVEVFVDSCEAWISVGQSDTDDDGRTAFSLPASVAPPVGAYGITQMVKGDASTVTSRLTVAPAGTRLVVFDVDGTLTVGDDELKNQMKGVYFEELASGKQDPRAYPGASALTKAWAAKGYLVVYITGRPYWLAGLTRTWLAAQGCEPGHLHTTDRSRDALPGLSGVGEFKAAYLQSLRDAGFLIDYVYGNAESDVFAYAKAGIPTSRTHIIGEHGGKGGTRGLTGGYDDEHLRWIGEQPAAEQPFRSAQ